MLCPEYEEEKLNQNLQMDLLLHYFFAINESYFLNFCEKLLFHKVSLLIFLKLKRN